VTFRVTILLFSIIISGGCFAQNSSIDSLESLVKSVPADTNKVWLLNQLVSSLREKDNNMALQYAEEAKALSELLKYNKGLCLALENLGWILYRQGNFSKSLAASTHSLKLSTALQDNAAIARCQINIAAIYYEQKLFGEAIDNFKKAFRTAERIRNSVIMARSCNNIAYSFYNQNNIDSALVYAQRGRELSEVSGEPYLIAFALRTLGDIQMSYGKSEEALALYNKCLDLSVKHANTFIKASVLHRLAKTYAGMGKYDRAVDYLNENVSIASQYGFRDELERAYSMFAEIYYKKNDLTKAFAYQSAYLSLHDSLYNQRSSEQIALMQIRFDSELKQAQIELLTKDAALQKVEINKQKVWIYFYAGCISLLVILAFVLFYYYRNNNKAKQALQSQNKAIETQTNQLRNLNSTKDKLFSIISHDLRSPVASLRAVMELVTRAELSQTEFMDLTKALKRNIDSVHDDLDNLLLWAQSQLKGLQAFPSSFDLGELASEKIKLFDDLARNKKINVTNKITKGLNVYADRNHVSLIFRNLLANAIKFNQPGGTIDIFVNERNEHCEVTVSDSGVGMGVEDIHKLFNAETHFTKLGTQREKGVGIGLLLTKEFVEKNEGSISVSSEVGVGTAFTFSLKLTRQEIFA
jgi:two-component system, sensor histidine kinase and response regulator